MYRAEEASGQIGKPQGYMEIGVQICTGPRACMEADLRFFSKDRLPSGIQNFGESISAQVAGILGLRLCTLGLMFHGSGCCASGVCFRKWLS